MKMRSRIHTDPAMPPNSTAKSDGDDSEMTIRAIPRTFRAIGGAAALAAAVTALPTAPAAAQAIITDNATEYAYCSDELGGRDISLILDATSRHDDQDIARIRDGVLGITRDMRVGDRLTIRRLVQHPGASAQIFFFGCKPGCHDTFNTLLSSCNDRKTRRDVERFERLMRGAVEQIVASHTPQNSSPLIEMIGLLMQGVEPDVLIVYSDFLQYTTRANAQGYVEVPFSAYSAKSADYEAHIDTLIERGLMPDLSGTGVIAFGFGKEISDGAEGRDWEALKAFWSRFFVEANAAGSPLLSNRYTINSLDLFPAN